MKFPWSNQKESKKARKPKQLKTLKQVLSEAWLRELKTNPDLLRKVAAKEAGFYELVDDGTDPIERIKQKVLGEALEKDPEFAEQVKQEYVASMNPDGTDGEDDFEATVSEVAMEKIKSDPKLMEAVTQGKIEEIIRSGKSRYGKASDLFKVLEEYREIQEMFGEKEERGTGFFTPEMMKSLLGDKGVMGLLGPILGLGGRIETPRTYVVETPEGTREFSPEEYKLYLEQRQRGELPAPFSKVLESAQTRPPIQSPSQTANQVQSIQIVPSPPTVPPSAPSLNISSWVPYLEQEPEVFASLLEEMALVDGSEGERAKFTLNVLRTKTANELLALLQPFKIKGGEVAQAIEALEVKKEWLESLIEIVKGEK